MGGNNTRRFKKNSINEPYLLKDSSQYITQQRAGSVPARQCLCKQYRLVEYEIHFCVFAQGLMTNKSYALSFLYNLYRSLVINYAYNALYHIDVLTNAFLAISVAKICVNYLPLYFVCLGMCLHE